MHGMKALISMLVAVLLPGMPSEMSAVPQLSADRQPTSQGSVVPGNPNQELPTTISPDIPNNATVVAGNLAVLSNGTVKSLNTGATVTSPKIVGDSHCAARPAVQNEWLIIYTDLREQGSCCNDQCVGQAAVNYD